MTHLPVEPTIRTVICSSPANEIDCAASVCGFLCQEYDSAFTLFGRRIHLAPTRRAPGIGRNQRSDLGYRRRLPLSFRAVPRSFDIVADEHDYNRCDDSAASIIYVSYRTNLRFERSYEVRSRTKSILQLATVNSFARITTLRSRYPVESILEAAERAG